MVKLVVIWVDKICEVLRNVFVEFECIEEYVKQLKEVEIWLVDVLNECKCVVDQFLDWCKELVEFEKVVKNYVKYVQDNMFVFWDKLLERLVLICGQIGKLEIVEVEVYVEVQRVEFDFEWEVEDLLDQIRLVQYMVDNVFMCYYDWVVCLWELMDEMDCKV